MKAASLIFPILLIIFKAAIGQTTNRIATYDYIINTNNISSSLDPTGAVGFGEANVPMFIAPAGSIVSPMFGSWLWVGAKDQYGETRVCAPNWYLLKNESNFGPYNYNTGVSNPVEMELIYAKYNRVWKVTQDEIETHKLSYDNMNYIIPEAILNWPGNGNLLEGFSEKLAPFGDINNNSIYEPMLGEYPLIKGDAAIYAIYHDNMLYEDDPSNNLNMGIEVHVMLYAFDAAINSFLFNTLFVNYKIINRGTFDFDSVYAGLFSDISIGAFYDDYIGSDSTLNLFYGYNGDLVDGPSTGIYNSLPAFGCVSLSHNLHAFMNFDGDATPTGFPDNDVETYYALNGKFGDGVAMTTGGIGYNPGSSNFTNYMYGGDVNTFLDWSEISAGNQPGERRGTGSIYLDVLPQGASTCATFAYIFADDLIGEQNTSSISLLKSFAAQTATIFNITDTTACLETKVVEQISDSIDAGLGFSIYPNPSEGNLTINNGFEIGATFSIEVYNVNGCIIETLLFTNLTSGETHTLQFNNLATGIYFFRLNYDGYTAGIPVIFK